MLVDSVDVKGFRGIAEGLLKGLTRLNILVGRNNTGKSTILEALYLASSMAHRDLLGRPTLRHVVMRRGWYGKASIDGLFHTSKSGVKGKPSCIIAIKTEKGELALTLEPTIPSALHLDALKSRGLDTTRLYVVRSKSLGLVESDIYHYFDVKGRYQSILEGGEPAETVKVMFLDWYSVGGRRGLESVYSLMRRLGGKESKRLVLDSLQAMYDVSDLEVLRYDGRWVLHVDYEGRTIPAHLMGDGFKLVLAYLMLLAAAREALVLLEEPELHTHPGLLRPLARAMVQSASRMGCQVIISTHSLELIDLLLKEARESGLENSDLKVFRLALRQGRLAYESYSLNEALEAREKLGWDLRE